MSNSSLSGNRRDYESPLVKAILIGLAYLIVFLMIVVPIYSVFHNALKEGPAVYWAKIALDPETRHAIGLTLWVAAITVLLNTVFGVAVAWLVTKFRFPGRTLLISMIDLPFAISPVAAGLMLVLLFGSRGYLGPFLNEYGIKLVFSPVALIIATTFVTLPFVARELIPVMQALGSDEELAAITLGANGWQTFWRITLPNIRWALLYGIILCNARAMGEFGAVYVVSGRIAGKTDTLPLRVDKLFIESDSTGSFAVASLLTLLALGTLVGKIVLEHWISAQRREQATEETATE